MIGVLAPATVVTPKLGSAPRAGAAAIMTWAAVAGVFLLRASLCLSVVPPWQHPDEPVHLLAVRLLAADPDADLAERHREAEREVVFSMIANNWWGYLGAPNPVEPPYDGDFEPIVGTRRPLGSLVYYRAVAFVSRLLGISGLYGQLQLMRLLSLCFGLAALLVGARGMYELAGAHGAVAVAVLAATHPQFVLVVTAASPDAAVCACGAAIWWGLARVVVAGPSWPVVACTSTAGLGAAVVRRTGIPLGAVAVAWAVLCGLVLLHRTPRRERWLVGGLAALALLAAAGFLVSMGPELRRQVESAWSLRPGGGIIGSGSPPPLLPYIGGVLQSGWFTAGWLTVPPPPWLVVMLDLVAVVVLMGGFVLSSTARGRTRAGTLLAVWLITVQAAAVFVFYYLNGLGAQGRYLLPALFPWLALLWMTLGRGLEMAAGPVARPVVVGVFAALDAVVLWGRLVPSFGPG